MNDSVSLLRLPAVMARVGLGRAFIYQLVALGEFPAPQRLSVCDRVSVWPSNLIDDWVNRQLQVAQLRPVRSGKSARRAAVAA